MSWAWFGAPLTSTDFSGSWNFSAPCGAGLLPWKAKQRRHCNVHSMWSSQTACQRLEDFHSIPSRCLASHSHICAEGQHGWYTFNFLFFGASKTMLSVDLCLLPPQVEDTWPKFHASRSSPLEIPWSTELPAPGCLCDYMRGQRLPILLGSRKENLG